MFSSDQVQVVISPCKQSVCACTHIMVHTDNSVSPSVSQSVSGVCFMSYVCVCVSHWCNCIRAQNIFYLVLMECTFTNNPLKGDN